MLYKPEPKINVKKHQVWNIRNSQKESATLKDMSAAGVHILVNVYNGTPGESLDFLHYKCFCKKAAENAMYIYPQTLPPSYVLLATAKHHSLYVHFQIQEWKVVVVNFSHL